MYFSDASPDYGGGFSLDELVGMTADEIYSTDLPNDQVFHATLRAAGQMLQSRLDFYRLVEIWADGHTVWHGNIKDDPVVTTPSGRLIRTQG